MNNAQRRARCPRPPHSGPERAPRPAGFATHEVWAVATYSIACNTEQEVKQELAHITNVQGSAAGYKNYQQ
jgi:hypothetical protein